jgi:NAD(P)-dependent dehydrogenase (short-subunit alcohol dehydrogenase family)
LTKVAIVTGAGRGIGRATAKLFAAEGAKVAAPSLTSANVDAVVADIEAAGGKALGIVCDISNVDQIKTAVEKVVAAYGGMPEYRASIFAAPSRKAQECRRMPGCASSGSNRR